MSVLSEKLKQYLSERNITIADLSKMCMIDRSTLHQYLNGKRVIKNLELLNKIMELLCLTFDEQQQLLDAYDLEQIGHQLYQQRKAVEKFLYSLPETAEEEYPLSIPSVMKDSELQIKHSMIQGEVKVRELISMVMKAAESRKFGVKLLLSPKLDKIVTDLFLSGGYRELKVTHIICFEPGNTSGQNYNLEALSNILRCSMALPKYNACCYYGMISERFAPLQIMPNLVITENVVLQISADGKTAFLQRDMDIIEYLMQHILRIEASCHTILKYYPELLSEINRSMDFISGNYNGEVCEICSGICSIQFWNEEIIRRYLNPELPGYNEIAKLLGLHAEALYNTKRKGHTVLLMSKTYVMDFVHTGVLMEYPSYFQKMPISKIDRRYLLEKILAACHEGWHEIRFVQEEKFPLDYRWEICASQNGNVFLQCFSNKGFGIATLSEPGVSFNIYDYLIALGNSRHAMGKEQSEDWFRKCIREYL